MAHDGASKNPNRTTTRRDKCSKILLRGVIRYFNTQNLNVALINQIEFRDSKVFTMIIESFTPQSKLKITMGLTFVQEIREGRKVMADIQECQGRSDECSMEDVDVGKLAEVLSDLDIAESSSIAAYAISTMLQQGDCDIFLASAFMLHGIISKHVPLSQRRLPLVSFDTDFEETIDKFLEDLSNISRYIMEDPKWIAAMENREVEYDSMDLVDGRLFRVVMQAMRDGSFHSLIPDSAQQDWEVLRRLVKQLSNQDLSVNGSLVPECSETTTASETDHDTETEALSVLPFSCPVFDNHLKCIHVTTNASIPYRTGAMKLYKETTHWHNHKRPLGQKLPRAQIISKWQYVSIVDTIFPVSTQFLFG